MEEVAPRCGLVGQEEVILEHGMQCLTLLWTVTQPLSSPVRCTPHRVSRGDSELTPGGFPCGQGEGQRTLLPCTFPASSPSTWAAFFAPLLGLEALLSFSRPQPQTSSSNAAH